MLKKTSGSNTWTNCMVFGDKGFSKGKHYWEIKINSFGNISDLSGTVFGITTNKSSSSYSTDMSVGMSNANYNISGSGCTGTIGSTLGVLLDFKQSFVKFYFNGTNIGTGVLIKGTTYYPVLHLYYVGDDHTVSFPKKKPKN